MMMTDFLVNEVPYDENKTVRMGNPTTMSESQLQRLHDEAWWGLKKSWWEALSNMPEDLQKSKSIFKKVFGDQKICKTYSVRNWIWTFSDEDKENVICPLVSKQGVSWEYDRTSKSGDKVLDLRFSVENHIRENLFKKYE